MRGANITRSCRKNRARWIARSRPGRTARSRAGPGDRAKEGGTAGPGRPAASSLRRARRTTEDPRCTARYPPRSTCPPWSARSWRSGTRIPRVRRQSLEQTPPTATALDLLRRPTHRKRHARHPPRRSPRLQGRVSSLPDDEGSTTSSVKRRLGLSRPAGRTCRREANLASPARKTSRRTASLSSTSEVPRIGRTSCRRLRGHDRAHGLLGRHVARPTGTMDASLRRERVVVAEAPSTTRDLLVRGPSSGALLPSLRHHDFRTTSSRRATKPSSTRRSTCGSRSRAVP